MKKGLGPLGVKWALYGFLTLVFRQDLCVHLRTQCALLLILTKF